MRQFAKKNVFLGIDKFNIEKNAEKMSSLTQNLSQNLYAIAANIWKRSRNETPQYSRLSKIVLHIRKCIQIFLMKNRYFDSIRISTPSPSPVYILVR